MYQIEICLPPSPCRRPHLSTTPTDPPRPRLRSSRQPATISPPPPTSPSPRLGAGTRRRRRAAAALRLAGGGMARTESTSGQDHARSGSLLRRLPAPSPTIADFSVAAPGSTGQHQGLQNQWEPIRFDRLPVKPVRPGSGLTGQTGPARFRFGPVPNRPKFKIQI